MWVLDVPQRNGVSVLHSQHPVYNLSPSCLHPSPLDPSYPIPTPPLHFSSSLTQPLYPGFYYTLPVLITASPTLSFSLSPVTFGVRSRFGRSELTMTGTYNAEKGTGVSEGRVGRNGWRVSEMLRLNLFVLVAFVISSKVTLSD